MASVHLVATEVAGLMVGRCANGYDSGKSLVLASSMSCRILWGFLKLVLQLLGMYRRSRHDHQPGFG